MKLDATALNQLFRAARTHNDWQDKPVDLIPSGHISAITIIDRP